MKRSLIVSLVQFVIFAFFLFFPLTVSAEEYCFYLSQKGGYYYSGSYGHNCQTQLPDMDSGTIPPRGGKCYGGVWADDIYHPQQFCSKKVSAGAGVPWSCNTIKYTWNQNAAVTQTSTADKNTWNNLGSTSDCIRVSTKSTFWAPASSQTCRNIIPGCTSCSISITDFTPPSAPINFSAGHTLPIDASYEGSPGNVKWTLTVDDTMIDEYTEPSISFDWDGKIGGVLISAGSHDAVLRVENANDPSCNDEIPFTFTVEECNLDIPYITKRVGPANLGIGQNYP